MSKKVQIGFLLVVKSTVILLPTVLSMYLLYYVQINQLWQDQTKARDLVTIGILAASLVASLAIFTWLKRKK